MTTPRGRPRRLGRFQVDDQLEFSRLLHRQISRFRAVEDPSGVNAGLAAVGSEARSIADKTTDSGKFAQVIDRWNGKARCHLRWLRWATPYWIAYCSGGLRQRFAAHVTGLRLIFGQPLTTPAAVPLEPLTLISGILAGARVAPSHFRICLDFTCAGHEPWTMSLLARRHHRLTDTRSRDNRNVASFGAIFTLSL
jgi:hypothetical protein